MNYNNLINNIINRLLEDKDERFEKIKASNPEYKDIDIFHKMDSIEGNDTALMSPSHSIKRYYVNTDEDIGRKRKDFHAVITKHMPILKNADMVSFEMTDNLLRDLELQGHLDNIPVYSKKRLVNNFVYNLRYHTEKRAVANAHVAFFDIMADNHAAKNKDLTTDYEKKSIVLSNATNQFSNAASLSMVGNFKSKRFALIDNGEKKNSSPASPIEFNYNFVKKDGKLSLVASIPGYLERDSKKAPKAFRAGVDFIKDIAKRNKINDIYWLDHQLTPYNSSHYNETIGSLNTKPVSKTDSAPGGIAQSTVKDNYSLVGVERSGTTHTTHNTSNTIPWLKTLHRGSTGISVKDNVTFDIPYQAYKQFIHTTHEW